MEDEFFTDKLIAELDGKPALEALEEAVLAARKAGFDYVDDDEAAKHFENEAGEVSEAFLNESSERAISEAGDLELMLVELVRRRGGTLSAATRESARKYLTRLNFVENKLRERDLTWSDVKWPDEIKPLWDEAKKAGL